MASNHYSKLFTTFISRQYVPGSFLFGFNILKTVENPDAIDKSLETVRRAQHNAEETGMNRIKLMFQMDEFGDPSPELQMVSQGTIMGFFCGSIIGGTIQSRESYHKFIERNQATPFHSMSDAKKRLQDKVFVGFFRGAWMWGWRLAFFTGSLSLITTTISVYRGKSSILEYIAAGTITGSIYKLKSGPKAMIAGGIIGGVLGTLGGGLSLGLMYLTGTSAEEIRYWQYKWKEEYQESKLQKLREIRENQTAPLLEGRNQIIIKEELLQSLNEDILDIKKSNPPESSQASKT